MSVSNIERRKPSQRSIRELIDEMPGGKPQPFTPIDVIAWRLIAILAGILLAVAIGLGIYLHATSPHYSAYERSTMRACLDRGGTPVVCHGGDMRVLGISCADKRGVDRERW